MTRAYSKMTTPRFIGLKLWERAWDIMFTYGSAATESRPEPLWESLGVLERLDAAARLSRHQDVGEKWIQLWTEINVVTLHKFIKMMPQRVRALIRAEYKSLPDPRDLVLSPFQRTRHETLSLFWCCCKDFVFLPAETMTCCTSQRESRSKVSPETSVQIFYRSKSINERMWTCSVTHQQLNEIIHRFV